MKVLWFTNTPALGENYLSHNNVVGGGWIKSLDKEMQKKIDLHIAFYHNKEVLPFKFGNTNYYPIYRGKKTFINKYIDAKLSRIILREDIGKYLDIINEVKPDLIHIHGTENSFGYILEKTNIPVIFSIQGIITVCYHKFLSGLEPKYLNVTKGIWYKLLGYKSLKLVYLNFRKMKQIEKDVFQLCKNIIGRTAWDRRVCSIMSPNSTYFHNDEILRDGFYENEWKNIKRDKLIIFTTNGNSYYKGFETISQTISLLIESGYKNFEWRVAGISKDSLIVKAVKKKLKALFPKMNLILIGNLSEQELINNLLESNIYIMPSHIENSPNNLCEAMILGMPCIATFAGGTGSLLKDGEEGILIQDGDPWAMAGAIIELVNNEKKVLEFSKNARIRALKRHDKNTIANDLMDIYRIIK